ncbi:TraX family protein [Paenibacillus lemnae]|uniref:Conjugal transfer protein TraX n=1 Tax=Paenibacillus lemnae TaxID=1330551 RepID=A0A848M8G4_PAELE|nr:TraX family protein [Paenibacillus lemnae]NMO96501.1 conjugal transfer protein TraX [Paenibacillus lemnae]
MQVLAMLTMLVDHVGLVFFSDQEIWRIIGRIAFPVYVYALVQGYQHTSSRRRYFIRLGIIALISQLPYQLALNPNGLNVVVTLAAGGLVLQAMDKTKSFSSAVLIAAAAALVMDLLNFDYGAYGLFLILIFRYTSSHMLVIWHLLLNLMFLYLYGWELQMWSLAPTLLMVYGPLIWKRLEDARVHPWVWRSFYPLHMVIIAILQR